MFAAHADDLVQLFTRPGRMVLLARSGARAVGYLSAVWSERMLAIEEVAVVPEARRQGIARSLVSAALRDAAGAVLSVAEANPGARALYHSFGFTQSARHLVYELRHV
jgi:ribosomal protein S18 acetylase RimI-like enzyme